MNDTSCSLISAVREGRLERVRELIDLFGLSYSRAWSEGYALLCVAIENKHKAVTKLLLTKGSKVNRKSDNPFNTPLHYAVINGDIEIVEMLLDRGANIDAKNQYEDTPLHIAVKNEKVEIAVLLLNSGANVNCEKNSGITPLHIAAKRVNLDIVKHLLKHGAYVDSAYNSSSFKEGYTPLSLAVENGREETVKLLLSSGANVNAKGKYGETPLHIAAEYGYLQIVEDLLKHGAHVNSTFRKCYTPLWLAIKEESTEGEEEQNEVENEENIEVVRLLLESGANVDAQDEDGKTILHLAVEKGRPVIIELILKHCPDVNNKSNRDALNVAVHGSSFSTMHREEYSKIVANLLQYGFTVNPAGFMKMCQSCRIHEDVNNSKLLHIAVEKGYLKIVEDILKCGTDVNMLYNSTSGKGCMLLHVAAKNKQEEVAKLLISNGADVNAQDETGKTPMFYATENADLKIVEVLLQHGADVNTSDGCETTALHFTALDENGRFLYDDDVKGEIAKLLLSRGANANAQTEYGKTTLQTAAQNGYVKVVEALLEYNADVHSSAEYGRTPLHLSAQKGNEVIIKMLLNKGANINAKQANGETALHLATQRGHKKVVEVLLECGAKVDSKAKGDTTPLHIAAKRGFLEIAEILLKFGADINSRDEYGRTALHIASKGGINEFYYDKVKFVTMVIALLEHGSDVNILSKDNCTPLDSAVDGIITFKFELDDCDSDVDTYYDGMNVCKKIAEILKQHIIKMNTANLYVNEKNLKSISNKKEFQNKCKKEIKKMKSEKIGNNNVTFHDILTKSTKLLAICARNENIVQVLKLEDCKTKFPIYASMINLHFRKGVERKELLEQAIDMFPSLFKSFPKLPYNCTDKILNHLSDKDLRIFIDACKPINVST